MKKTGIKSIILTVGVICLLLVAGYFIRQNSHVRFKDENMGIVICNTIGHGVTPETVLYKDLEDVSWLDTGYLGYYETLVDIGKCRNVEVIVLNGNSYERHASYEVTHNEVGRVLTEEEVMRVESELAQIVPKLRKLEVFSFADMKSNCNIQNWDFISRCSNLREISIEDSSATDYSFLEELTDIKEIDLWGSQISTADSLINLQNPMRLCIYDTPLAENEEEIQKLCEALPNTEILISGDRVENEQHWDLHEYYSRD